MAAYKEKLSHLLFRLAAPDAIITSVGEFVSVISTGWPFAWSLSEASLKY